MKQILGASLALCLFSGQARAVLIEFTGGTVYKNDGTTAVTDGTTSFDNVSYYEEGGFRLEFMFDSSPVPFGTHVGDYYGTGNDVFHAHWSDNGNQWISYGTVSEIKISKIDGTTFDLGGFRVSTNTAIGGGFSDGNEMAWINTSKASNIFMIDSDNWGLGSGPDPLITIAAANTLFDDISWFSFTNDPKSSAVGLGLDNFFLDEAGDPGGTDPTAAVPEPGSLALLGLGLLGFGFSQRRKDQA